MKSVKKTTSKQEKNEAEKMKKKKNRRTESLAETLLSLRREKSLCSWRFTYVAEGVVVVVVVMEPQNKAFRHSKLS